MRKGLEASLEACVGKYGLTGRAEGRKNCIQFEPPRAGRKGTQAERTVASLPRYRALGFETLFTLGFLSAVA